MVRMLVSNNDETVKVFEVRGQTPDFAAEQEARLERRKALLNSGASLATLVNGLDAEDDVNELDDGGDSDEVCVLEHIRDAELHLPTAVNHSESLTKAFHVFHRSSILIAASVSPDGRKAVSVGDTNEVFLFDVQRDGHYKLVHSFTASADASFSTDWSRASDKFAVASQGGRAVIALRQPRGTS